LVVVNVWPSLSVPDTTGGADATGAAGIGITTAVASELAACDPAALVAVT
jgi:hypothetical protein